MCTFNIIYLSILHVYRVFTVRRSRLVKVNNYNLNGNLFHVLGLIKCVIGMNIS